MLEVGILILSLGIILFSAELFTNGVEWLGKRWGLSEGAVGCVLAAVGTALPETLVPVIAILTGGGREAATQIGIGAIVGAPFMLGTLAFCVTGAAAFIFYYRRHVLWMRINREIMLQDLTFFILVYSLAIITAFLPFARLKLAIALVLLGLYSFYVWRTLKSGQAADNEELAPLLLARASSYPALRLILLQVGLALTGILTGAHFFVDSVEVLAARLSISPLILSLIITPIATELPEKFNSIIWVFQGKDTLALGNITGAMVFQSSVIPAIGIFLTPWTFTWNAVPMISAVFAIASASLVLFTVWFKGRLHALNLLAGGLFYLMFITLL
ncbi:MAG TPA: sodium:calcium antiporter, partial [Bacillota bacterium]|nr:sodium:calcium antiporter [Bacillota bacterium]